MTARIIWLFKNSEHNAVAPRSASSAGAAHAARPVVLPQHGRAAPSFLPPRVSGSARGNSAPPRFGDGAFVFDATEGRWISRPSSMTEDAVAPADQEHSEMRHYPFPTLPSPAAVPSAAGRFLREAVEVISFAAGMTVFGLIAAFFLVMT